MNPLDADEQSNGLEVGLAAARRGFARRPERASLFARLPLPVAPGDIRILDGLRYRVETARVADDLRDAKCVLNREPA